MQPNESSPSNFHMFRQGVRRMMRQLNRSTRGDAYKLSPTSSQQLLQRLHLYQLELEKQKEEMRRTQAALDSSRGRFVELLEYTSALYDLAPVGYFTLTSEGNIAEANLTAAGLLQARRDSLLQQPITSFILEDDLDIFYAFRTELLSSSLSSSPSSHHSQPVELRRELRMVRLDGSPFFVQMDAAVIHNIWGTTETEGAVRRQRTKEPYIRITISDISVRVQLEAEERRLRADLETTLADLRQTQEQLVRQERLAVIGQMAAGVAHDFNNIMASITLYSQLVMRAPDLPSALHKRIEAIVTQSDRAATLVQQLLDFSRNTVMTRVTTSMCDFLQRFVEMLQQTLPDTIQATLDCSTLRLGIDDVAEIDPGRIQQVLLNLALNAQFAMPEGGRLHLSLSRLHTEESIPDLASGTLPPGHWLQLDVSDTGTGIKAEDMPHLFEPFFTTKGIGQGSGLGLAQVFGLVKQHSGEIAVRSEVGKGATFSIYLPVSSAAPAVYEAPEPVVVPHGRGEVVLVVEDSDFLRAALVSVLAQLGYKTVAASNGQEAFDVIIKQADDIDVILSDLSMPIMGGKELIRALRAQGWEHPVVVLSGQPLSQSEIVQLESYGQVSRLQKPAVMDRLALALHQALHPQAA